MIHFHVEVVSKKYCEYGGSMEIVTRKTLFIVLFIALQLSQVTSIHAAPIGVPGATVGVDQSAVGVELDFLIDRDLDSAGQDAEGMTLYAKGEIGVTKRIDFLARLGFGRFEAGGSDSDAGPAFGFGTKVTWAAIPKAGIKIGSVAQMTQIRADKGNIRQSLRSYDLALGLYADSGQLAASQGKGLVLTTYGGLAFSSVDIEGTGTGGGFAGKEDNSYGLFVGLLAKMNQRSNVGIELRLVDQTALSLFSAISF